MRGRLATGRFCEFREAKDSLKSNVKHYIIATVNECN